MAYPALAFTVTGDDERVLLRLAAAPDLAGDWEAARRQRLSAILGREFADNALAIDAQRFTECAFWMAFWGQVSADKKLKRLNVWVHREYMRLFARCFAEHWTEWPAWPQAKRDQTLRSVVTFINGLTASAVTSPNDWPAHKQVEQLRLQLDLLRQWANASRTRRVR